MLHNWCYWDLSRHGIVLKTGLKEPIELFLVQTVLHIWCYWDLSRHHTVLNTGLFPKGTHHSNQCSTTGVTGIYPDIVHYWTLAVHPFIHPSLHPSIYTPLHPCIPASIHPFIHPSIHPSIHSFPSTTHSTSIPASIHSYILQLIFVCIFQVSLQYLLVPGFPYCPSYTRATWSFPDSVCGPHSLSFQQSLRVCVKMPICTPTWVLYL